MIIREPYHFKTLEDISHLLADATVMTILDCKKGNWHQELDKASSYLTMFNMKFGRYWYTVMPFGTTIMGDVFQRKLDQCFGYLQNVIVIADDILVVGEQPNHKDHNQALTALLNTARKCNICLNHEKLQYKQQEVKFFRETYTTDSCKPAQSKIRAIQEMLAPQCKKQVPSFIGMVNYLSKFSAGISKLAEPIRDICKEKVPFNWGPEHDGAFQLIKRRLLQPKFWHTTTLRNLLSYKLMQAVKD